MFERYTEKARRVIFFARYEASQFGSPHIDSEHLLLGLIREDKPLIRTALPNLESPGKQLRAEIEAGIGHRPRISTSVEMPLSQECKHILNFAAEEAERLAEKGIATHHLLLGILDEGTCTAARILLRHGAVAADVRQKITTNPTDDPLHTPSRKQVLYASRVRSHAGLGIALDAFLKAWAARDAKRIAELFMPHGQLWDITGGLWHSLVQIERGLVAHFSVIEPAEAAPDVRDIKMVTAGAAVMTLVWEPRGEAKQHNTEALRMVLVFCEVDPQWQIVSAHLAVVPPRASAVAHQA